MHFKIKNALISIRRLDFCHSLEFGLLGQASVVFQAVVDYQAYSVLSISLSPCVKCMGESRIFLRRGASLRNDVTDR